MQTLQFKTKLFKIAQWTILRLPEKESIKLPSRSQVMVKGTINDVPISTVLEPDGKWSHFLKVNKAMQDATGASAGDVVTVVMEPSKDWPEPKIPADLKDALDNDRQVYDLWMNVTTMARWEWIRWITSTKNPETRAKRIVVSFSKLRRGEKRPCCFNRAMCTDPYVSKSGRLIDPKGE